MDDSGETYVVEFYVTPQQTMVDGFDNMAWDYALGKAHEAGVIPIGPIHIETELVKPPGAGFLEEGVPMRVQSMASALGLQQELVKVTASMMVGTRLA